MRTFTFYIEDERYSVPTLLFVTTRDEAHARRLARQKLAEPHHLSVEVRDGDDVLFKLVPQKHAQTGRDQISN